MVAVFSSSLFFRTWGKRALYFSAGAANNTPVVSNLDNAFTVSKSRRSRHSAMCALGSRMTHAIYTA